MQKIYFIITGANVVIIFNMNTFYQEINIYFTLSNNNKIIQKSIRIPDELICSLLSFQIDVNSNS